MMFLLVYFFSGESKKSEQNLSPAKSVKLKKVPDIEKKKMDTEYKKNVEQIKNAVKAKVYEAFGKQTNWGEDVFEKIESSTCYDESYPTGGIEINLFVKIDKKITNGVTVSQAVNCSWNLMKNIFDDIKLGDVVKATVFS
jgi:hypothetical protein